jgi:raffinose/stachyose/melibiose transport system substrate-binding protein
MTQSYDRRTFLARGGRLGLGLSGAGAVLAACGSSGTTRQAAKVPAVAPAAGALSFWYSVANAKQGPYYVEHDLGGFQHAHPKIRFDAVQKPLETLDRIIQTALQAGRGPDVIFSSGAAQVVQFAQAHQLMPLDAYAAHYDWKSRVFPWALNTGRVDKRLYSIPIGYESMVVYYNKTLFGDKGWKPPTNRDELIALATDASAQGIVPFAAGNAEWRRANEWLSTVFLNHVAGPQAVQEALTGKRPWTDPVFAEALGLMADWFAKGWFQGGSQRYFAARFAPVYESLAAGKAAMFISGTWDLASLDEPFAGRGEWDWFSVPPLGDGVPASLYTLATGGTLSVNGKAKAPGAGGAYLDWVLSDPKRQAAQVAAVGLPPAPIALSPSDFPPDIDERSKRFYTEFSKSTATGTVGYTTWTFFPPRSDAYIAEDIEKLLVGRQSVKEYLDGLQRTFTTELRRGAVPPLPEQS